VHIAAYATAMGSVGREHAGSTLRGRHARNIDSESFAHHDLLLHAKNTPPPILREAGKPAVRKRALFGVGQCTKIDETPNPTPELLRTYTSTARERAQTTGPFLRRCKEASRASVCRRILSTSCSSFVYRVADPSRKTRAQQHLCDPSLGTADAGPGSHRCI
jgi:hypothetical protein